MSFSRVSTTQSWVPFGLMTQFKRVSYSLLIKQRSMDGAHISSGCSGTFHRATHTWSDHVWKESLRVLSASVIHLTLSGNWAFTTYDSTFLYIWVLHFSPVQTGWCQSGECEALSVDRFVFCGVTSSYHSVMVLTPFLSPTAAVMGLQRCCSVND